MKFSFKSNSREVFNALQKQLDALQNDKIARIGALEAQAIVQTRVQQRGSGSKGKLSGYSSAYAKRRRKKGRQVSRKDLTFEGDLFRNWITGATTGGWAVGFASEREAQKAEYLEIREGKIFELSQAEEAETIKAVSAEIAKILK